LVKIGAAFSKETRTLGEWLVARHADPEAGEG
jgi:hypothetical protein